VAAGTKEGSSLEWVQIDNVPEDYILFDLETLMDCPFKKWMKFGKGTYLCLVKQRRVKEITKIIVPSTIYVKKIEYEYTFSKYIEQFNIQLLDIIDIDDKKGVIQWISHEDDHVWIGIDCEKGDSDGTFRGKKRFQCKTKSMFVNLDSFELQSEPTNWAKRKSTGLFGLFKKKKERVGLPIYCGEKKEKESERGEGEGSCETN